MPIILGLVRLKRPGSKKETGALLSPKSRGPKPNKEVIMDPIQKAQVEISWTSPNAYRPRLVKVEARKGEEYTDQRPNVSI